MKIENDLKYLKQYCYDYIKKQYGEKQDYIRKTRITKYGLFIYGHKVYAPVYSLVYTINTFINFYDINNYDFINDMLDNFVLDCKRLNEYKRGEEITKEETKRTCTECGKEMTKGYCIENGIEYYCSEECLHKNISEEEFNELYDNGNGDSYWTEWEEN